MDHSPCDALVIPASFNPQRGHVDHAAVGDWLSQSAVPALQALLTSQSSGEETAVAAAKFVPLCGTAATGEQRWLFTRNFMQTESWCTPLTTELATRVLGRVVDAHEEGGAGLHLVQRILAGYIKPLLEKREHGGRVDSETGRARRGSGAHPSWLAADEDGTAAEQHAADPRLGAWNVFGWCIAQVGQYATHDTSVWEQAWALIVPGIMALLDAPSARAKLYGTRLALRLLDNDARAIPATLLQRTGVGALFEDALSRAMYHMTDADVGAALLHASILAQRSLASSLYGGDAERVFAARSRIFSEGVLGALSYCSPASSSTQALLAPSHTAVPTLSSARLQQTLAGVANVAALPLLTDLGAGSVRFWNATMDWHVGWLSNAFSASTKPFPVRAANTPLTELVGRAEDALRDGHALEEADRAPEEQWYAAAHVLLESLCASTAVVLVMARAADTAAQGPSILPARVPGLHAWGTRVLAAAAKCWLRLDDLVPFSQNASSPSDPLQAHSADLARALTAMCDALYHADPALKTVCRVSQRTDRSGPPSSWKQIRGLRRSSQSHSDALLAHMRSTSVRVRQRSGFFPPGRTHVIVRVHFGRATVRRVSATMPEEASRDARNARRGAQRGSERGRGRGRGGHGGALAKSPAITPEGEPALEESADAVSRGAEATTAKRAFAGSEPTDPTSEERESEADAEVCFICADPIKLYAVPPCNHRICHICSVRLRAMWKKQECTFCKDDAKQVIFSSNGQRAYGDFTPDELPVKDAKLSVLFERQEDLDETLALLRFNCPHTRCDAIRSSWSELKLHVKKDHSRMLWYACSVRWY